MIDCTVQLHETVCIVNQSRLDPISIRLSQGNSIMHRAIAAILCLTTSAFARAEEPITFSAQEVAFYEKDVQPLLKENCLRCHGEKDKIRGGLNLMNRAALIEGGDTGPAIDLKNPEKSLLLRALHYEGGYEMPPSGKLKDAEIALITTWVKAGLPWTAGNGAEHVVEEKKKGVDLNYWAYQPVQRPDRSRGSKPSLGPFADRCVCAIPT